MSHQYEGLSRFFASRKGIILAGAVIGLFASLLQKFGNPLNMGICVACFERDIAGALGLHRAAVVQYLRPEIMGFVLGATIAALSFGEFKAFVVGLLRLSVFSRHLRHYWRISLLRMSLARFAATGRRRPECHYRPGWFNRRHYSRRAVS